MKTLLDECVDWRLARDLKGHEVSTVQQMGWSGIANGELLARAEGAFDVLLTTDTNLPNQQTFRGRTIALLALRPRSNRLIHLRVLLPKLASALESVQRGTVTIIS
jgi:predicted nuclease of predicted toxin-antitoxin system